MLVQENERAAAALDVAQEQLQALCQAHAGTFVAVEGRTKEIRSQLDNVLQSVAATSVIAAQEAVADTSNLDTLTEQHRVRRRTLLQHETLLQLFELPVLMDACVRSEMYEESLQIASFCQDTLRRRHANDDVVMRSVVDQIEHRQADLRSTLFQKLKGQLSMPECLAVVTALRRLNAIELEASQNLEAAHTAREYQLAVDFLQARNVWVGGEQQHMTLLDTIERHRTRIFEVATQFQAMFQGNVGSVLKLWMTRRVQQFLHLLEYELPKHPNVMRDALDASVFFAVSLGRLGADFSAQLSSIVDPIVVRTYCEDPWKKAGAVLVETLEICRSARATEPLVTSLTDSVPSTHTRLMSYPPLARWVNAILAGLNELRRCLLPTTFVRIRQTLKNALDQLNSTLLEHVRTVAVPGAATASMREIAADLLATFEAVVVPYCWACLETALGNEAASDAHTAVLNENLKKLEPEEEKSGAEQGPGGDEEPDVNADEPDGGTETDLAGQAATGDDAETPDVVDEQQ